MTPFVLDVVDGQCNGHCGPRRDCCEAPLDPPLMWNGHPLTCQTCDSEGEFFNDLAGHVQDCPDCVDGHPIISADCPHCMKCYDTWCHTCDVCCEFGSVRVSVQAVPIEDNAASQRRQPHVAVSTVYVPSGEAFLWIDADTPVVTVDVGPEPLAQVGRFAIIATPVGDDQ